MIVERLNSCISSLMSPYQTGFMSGSSIHENTIIVKGVMNIMKKKKSEKGLFAIKIDLSKAYDKLSWASFVKF